MLNDKATHVLRTIARAPGTRFSLRSQYRKTADALCVEGYLRHASGYRGAVRFTLTEQAVYVLR